MRASVVVSELTINDGTKIPLPSKGLVLIVGPNNSGKSQALRDVLKLATSVDQRGVVITEANVSYRGTSADLLTTFTEDRAVRRNQFGEDVVPLGSNGSTQSLSSVPGWWPASAHIVAPYFLVHADTESRLEASRPTGGLNLYEENPYSPLHWVYQNRDIEVRLDKISREAFNLGLVLDTWSGGTAWSSRVGNLSQPSSPRPDQAFPDALNKLPLLHEEGDGVRSMLGLLLTLFTGHQSISLIDEPEAFLHPPQAHYLGKVLGRESTQDDTSVFVSTHSSEFLNGVLETDAQTTVLRVTRDGAFNRVSVLDNDAVRKLWLDPLLKYSNLLDGLFADAVIVCESEADCKYYAATRDTLVDSNDVDELQEAGKDGDIAADSDKVIERSPDLLFTNCGGKHRMHTAVTALRAASVPVAVVADFDLLNDWSVLCRLIEAAGGNPAEFESDWKVLNSAVASKAPTPSIVAMREAITDLLAKMEGPRYSKKDAEAVRSLAKLESGWDAVKKLGVAGVPANDPHNACLRILQGLSALRIHLVQVGEMEDFVKAAGGHGPAWLSEVLERELHTASDSDGAREFMKGVLASLA